MIVRPYYVSTPCNSRFYTSITTDVLSQILAVNCHKYGVHSVTVYKTPDEVCVHHVRRAGGGGGEGRTHFLMALAI